jgi:hypothetical protein
MSEMYNIINTLPPIRVRVLCWFGEKKLWVIDELWPRGLSDGGGAQFVCNYDHNYTHWTWLPGAPKEGEK